MRLTLFSLLILSVAAVPCAASEVTGLTPDESKSASAIAVSVNESKVLDHAVGIRRISIANPEIAEAVAVSTNEIVVNGKAAGDTSLIVWDLKGNRTLIDVHVLANTLKIDTVRAELLKEAGPDVTVEAQEGTVFLNGTVANETAATRALYGLDEAATGSFASKCLMARRLSEAGVRFVEIRQGGWDHHTNLHNGLIEQSRMIDQPTSALLADLKQRGLLEDTLVLFGSEFGRLPTSQGADGRDHNITGYAMFMAGAGIKKGFSYGATDEIGMTAVDGRMRINDLHATLLALMGIDHEELTYRYAGRDFRLTNVAGIVQRQVFA